MGTSAKLQQIFLVIYLEVGLNLQRPGDLTKKKFSTKCIYPLCYVTSWTSQSEFWGLIDLKTFFGQLVNFGDF